MFNIIWSHLGWPGIFLIQFFGTIIFLTRLNAVNSQKLRSFGDDIKSLKTDSAANDEKIRNELNSRLYDAHSNPIYMTTEECEKQVGRCEVMRSKESEAHHQRVCLEIAGLANQTRGIQKSLEILNNTVQEISKAGVISLDVLKTELRSVLEEGRNA